MPTDFASTVKVTPRARLSITIFIGRVVADLWTMLDFRFWSVVKNTTLDLITGIDMSSEELLAKIPEMAQRQDSTTEQINDLLKVATKLGMYDARDWIEQTFYDKRNKSVLFGYDKR
jgi:hypothetical protein